ncbi:MAG: HNH endonuclease [Planctomycetota bacterium]|jgi:hypothetical protein
MSTLTKVNISFSLSVPTILVRAAVWIVLVYRRVCYGYAFRRIKLTRGKYAIVDVEDFERLNQYKWHSTHYGYAKRAVSKRCGKGRKQVEVYMHKLVCPAPAGMIVDHINRNSVDNRRVNLRAATQKQNVWNRKFARKRGRTRYNGIRWDKNKEKWQVRLTIDGRRRSFGYYADEIEAAKAYDRAARKYRGEYAFLNFPEK